jgi:hypothetical protein
MAVPLRQIAQPGQRGCRRLPARKAEPHHPAVVSQVRPEHPGAAVSGFHAHIVDIARREGWWSLRSASSLRRRSPLMDAPSMQPVRLAKRGRIAFLTNGGAFVSRFRV